MQVVKVADEFKDPELLDKVWVYDDGIIKGSKIETLKMSGTLYSGMTD